jgi:serine O-acetyltransferase
MSDSSAIETSFATHRDLAAYVSRQADFFSYALPNHDSRIEAHLPEALARMRPILACARAFEPGVFNHLNSMQYATFLYLLGNEAWLHSGVNEVSERLFLLNKALHGLDMYYKLTLPKVFLVAHGVGTVLANATYGENFVFFQNVTVGRMGDRVPVIGDNVVLFPGCMVLGDSIIGHNSVVSAGTVVVNQAVPEDSVAFPGIGRAEIRPRRKPYLDEYLDFTGFKNEDAAR